MQARARGPIRNAGKNRPARQVGARERNAYIVARDIGGAEVALIAAHLVEERGRPALSDEIGMPFAASQKHAGLIENSGDVAGIEALLEQFRQPLRRQAETEKMCELPVLHHRGGYVVDRLARHTPDHDSSDDRLSALAHLAIARQVLGRQRRPERNARVHEMTAARVTQHHVSADIVANLGGLTIEALMIADRKGARQGQRLQRRLQAGKVAVDGLRQLMRVVEQVLVDARDFRIVVTLKQNRGEQRPRNCHREHQQQQVPAHGQAAQPRADLDQKRPPRPVSRKANGTRYIVLSGMSHLRGGKASWSPQRGRAVAFGSPASEYWA